MEPGIESVKKQLVAVKEIEKQAEDAYRSLGDQIPDYPAIAKALKEIENDEVRHQQICDKIVALLN